MGEQSPEGRWTGLRRLGGTKAGKRPASEVRPRILHYMDPEASVLASVDPAGSANGPTDFTRHTKEQKNRKKDA